MGQALDNVHRIYLEGIAGGQARKAVHACTGHRYTQHSTGVVDGAEGFLAFFEPFLDRNPKRDIRIVRSFQDGPWCFAALINPSMTARRNGSRWTCSSPIPTG